MGRRGYPQEFRRKGLNLITAGHKVADVARDLGVSNQTIYSWLRQERVKHQLESGLMSAEREELIAARRRIAQLEAELEVHRSAAEFLRRKVRPKGAPPMMERVSSVGLRPGLGGAPVGSAGGCRRVRPEG